MAVTECRKIIFCVFANERSDCYDRAKTKLGSTRCVERLNKTSGVLSYTRSNRCDAETYIREYQQD